MADSLKASLKRRAPAVRNAIARALRVPRRVAWIDHAIGDVDFLLDCPTVRRHLSDAHDHQLTPWQARLVRAHLATCAICPTVQAELDDTIAALRELRDIPPR